MRWIKQFISWAYWSLIGEVTIGMEVNEKTVMISLKQGDLHRLYVGPEGLTENIIVKTGYISDAEFNFIKSIYETQ